MGKASNTLEAIFAEPTRANIPWRDVESLLRYLGAEVRPGTGSRSRVRLNGVRATFHRPHPQAEIHKPLVRSIRRFLAAAGEAP